MPLFLECGVEDFVDAAQLVNCQSDDYTLSGIKMCIF